ncbi:hypothetical protein PG994_014176 [Apiospora phragmitis]|uniref:Uncharacterized protein n=1 Tax=Apiospora phragmitis TaxID=2905665 RepID=A0ABR1T3K5_9PEZI
MASTSASTSGSPVAASASNVTVVPPAAGQQQQAGFHAAPSAHIHVPMQQQHTFQLTPEMEQGIKAAVAATNPTPALHPRKERSSWLMAKYFLRCSTLFACVGVIIGEVIVAITQRAELDTAICVIWGLIYACWHTLRLIELKKKKGIETITPLILIIDGLLLVAAVICVGLLMWRLIDGALGGSPEWHSAALQDRGVIFLIIISSVGQALRGKYQERELPRDANNIDACSSMPGFEAGCDYQLDVQPEQARAAAGVASERIQT